MPFPRLLGECIAIRVPPDPGAAGRVRALCFRRFRAALTPSPTDRPGGPSDSRAGRSRRWELWGLLVWALPLLVVAVLVARDPASRSVTPTFHLAVSRWAAGQPLYSDPRGFHYLPQFVLLFAPFHALPAPIGDLLWRVLAVGAVVGGLRSFLRRTAVSDPGLAFFWASVLCLGPCLGAMRNGQTNLVFGGLLLALAVLLAGQRWTGAAACLVVLCAVKPFGIVFVLLAPFVYPRLVRPLAAGLALFLLSPFLVAPASYASAQCLAAVGHIVGWAGTTENRFADLAGVLRAAGVALPVAALTSIRALAALASLGAWIAVGRRAAEPEKALGLGLIGGIYLMLFNPMTEKNTYAVVAPALCVAAVLLLAHKSTAAPGRIVAFALVSIGVFPEVFRRLDPNLGLWWDPLVLGAAAGALAWALRRRIASPLAPPEVPAAPGK
jgi:alpha-1,2-mannosyltransferase